MKVQNGPLRWVWTLPLQYIVTAFGIPRIIEAPQDLFIPYAAIGFSITPRNFEICYLHTYSIEVTRYGKSSVAVIDSVGSSNGGQPLAAECDYH